VKEREAIEDGELVTMGKGKYLVMVTEEEEALMVKVLESFVGDEPFHSSKVMVLLDTDEDDSMPSQTLITSQFAGCFWNLKTQLITK